MFKDLISIIFPIYNGQKTIERSIGSALGQTYQKIEVILVDDGSVDDTGFICDRIAQQDSRVRVFHILNGGKGNARNFGLAAATGTYVIYCDADDYMHPDMIEKMYSFAQKENADEVICSWNFVDQEGVLLPWRTTDLKNSVMGAQKAQKIFLSSVNFEGFCWNKLIRKSLYEKSNIKYDGERLSYCDILANYNLLGCADRVAFIEDKLYDYYQMPYSCVHTPSIRKYYDYVETLQQVLSAATQNNMEKEGRTYLVYRLNKHLFGIYKESKQSMSFELADYYCQSYERWLKFSFLKKVGLIVKYPDDPFIKSMLKAIIVSLYYRRLKSKYISMGY